MFSAMRLATYQKHGREQLAFVWKGKVFDTSLAGDGLPQTMGEALNQWQQYAPLLEEASQRIDSTLPGIAVEDACLLAPVPNPAGFRDAYAFRQHVETARRNRGLPMIPEFELFPVFYFSNHHTITGSGDIYCMPHHLQKLDFELEVAIVIGKGGVNIEADDAHHHIAGFMILNDFSARELQMQEMKLNLGPAKGKDFASATGPWLVTLPELKDREITLEPGRGPGWNLAMKARVNGVQVSTGNLKDMYFSFGEIIERCSYGARLLPGDIIGSGTVGSGCFLELNGTAKSMNPQHPEQWLKPGDIVELEVERLGVLANRICTWPQKQEKGL